MTPRRFILASTLLLGPAMLLPGGGALAQGNPSADQIINSLRPGGSMMGGTRGIRPVAPSEAPPPAAPPVAGTSRPAAARPAAPSQPPPATAAGAVSPSVNLSVQFATGSAELTPAAVRTLTELGRALSSNALNTYRFRIEGHTDTVGSAESNKVLSDRRAQAVVLFLSTQFRIDPSRLEAAGLGEEGLLVQTPANTPEPRNRRVQVINIGA